MFPGLFAGATAVKVRALYLGERLDLRALETVSRLSPQAPLVLSAGAAGAAVLFRYGVIVLFHVPPLDEAAFVATLTRLLGEPFARVEVEEIEVRVLGDQKDARADAMEANVLSVGALSIERVQLIGEILARSVALARYEAVMKESFTAVEA
ncbi:MAG: RMD1 family protein [Deltaproteobacteria bacterium]|nr:RMD1 family protein [Deltaproteobacteria bacterium]